MKASGASLSEIAQELNLADSASVVHLLDEQMRIDAAYLNTDQRATLLGLEWERLERIIKANWQSTMFGDPASTKHVLAAMQMQIKLAQLDVPDASHDQARVLVVGGLEADYVETLKQMTEQ